MFNEWEIESGNWSRPVHGALAVGLMQHVGHAGFAQALLGHVNAHAEFEHCTIYELLLERSSMVTCRVLDAASRRAIPTARETSRLFAQKFAQHEVNGRFLTGSRSRRGDFATHFLSRDLPHPDYREVCYTRNGLADRFSLVRVEGDRALALNFYKGTLRGETVGSEREHLLGNAPFLVEAVARHAALTQPSRRPSGADLLARLTTHVALTEREAQVCALLLEGFTVPQAAIRMGIRPSTATTLKKRAFVRLGVRTKEEMLLALAS